MRVKSFVSGLTLMFLATAAFADLEPWKDYEMSDAVYSVTAIQVDPNMGDAYLEGIKNTWAAGNDVAKELGQIEDYWIYRSDLPQSGHFNLLLVIKFSDTADLAPSQEQYEAFVAAIGQEANDEATEFAQKNYPGMRKITGQYNMREITLK